MLYLVFVYQVVHYVFVSTNRDVLSQLGLRSVQPVVQGLESISESAWEEQRLLQLVLPEEKQTRNKVRCISNFRTFFFFFLMLGRNLNPVPIDCIIPLHGLAADGVPRVFEFSHLIFQMLSVTAGLSSLVKVASVLRCGVVHGPLRSQQLLELLTSD